MSADVPAAEAELEAFRNEWRAEVTARTRQPPDRQGSTAVHKTNDKKTSQPSNTTKEAESSRVVHDLAEELEPRSYHDLPDQEEQLRLSNAGQDHDRHRTKEPSSALEHYERGVEKESQGQLGDSMKHYRKAFKLDDNVHELYKKKHFPAQPKAHRSTTANLVSKDGKPSQKVDPLPATLQDIVKSFATSRIEAPPPPTDASPAQRSLLGELPQEILIQVLTHAAVTDVSALAKVSVVCKHLAYLVMTEETIWKAVALRSRFGFANMLYRYACDVDGNPLRVVHEAGFTLDDLEDDGYDEALLLAQSKTVEFSLASQRLTQKLLIDQFTHSWRQMYRSRPRVRFNGCYISTVNYTRPGGGHTNTLSWGVPVHVVTYYRYLRFFRDGTAISLLTTAEPIDVVHHLIKDNLHHHHGNALPSAIMKDALRGRWRLTGPNSGLQDPVTQEVESEGEVLVETQGSSSRYTFEMRFAFSSAGKGARNNKLAWRSFKSRNRLTDDEAPFNLKHDRGFYWSRVRSFN